MKRFTAMPWPGSLRWQMALAIVIAILGLTALIVAGMSVFYGIADSIWMKALSPELREAYKQCIWGDAASCAKLPPIGSIRELETVSNFEGVTFIALCIIGLVLGAIAGVLLGGRIAKPIESVAMAASLVAGG